MKLKLFGSVVCHFLLMLIVFNFLISCFLIYCSFLVHVYSMADVPVAKRVWRAIGTGKNSRLHMHLIGIKQADIWSALHAMLSMMDPPAPTWCPRKEWRCPPPCCKSWRWLDGNTVQQLERQCFQPTYGAYVAYLIDLYLGAKTRGGLIPAPPGFGKTVLIKLIKLIWLSLKIISISNTYSTYDLLIVTYDLLIIYLWIWCRVCPYPT